MHATMVIWRRKILLPPVAVTVAMQAAHYSTLHYRSRCRVDNSIQAHIVIIMHA
jgi:hypothetical protein